MTDKQIADLRAAIQAATCPGACRYMLDGAPSCVIAQLYTIRGGSLDALAQCEDGSIGVAKDDGRAILWKNGASREIPELSGFPGRLLESLQEAWDEGKSPTEELWERRAKLHDIVNEAQQV